jgi:2-dehydropantoate 2-reductase
MRIAVMGAGAIGGYLGARLSAAGEDVTLIARGAHLEAIRRDGIRIESPHGNLHVPKIAATEHPATIGPVDVVLFTVKLWDTEAAARALAPLIGPQTRVITLQNGIDSVDLIAGSVPRERIAAGVIYLSAGIAQPGVVGSPGGVRRLTVDAQHGNPVVAAFVAAVGRVGVDARATDAIDPVIWEKFVRLTAHSGTTSLMRTTLGPIMANPETVAFLVQLLEEGIAIAGARGVRLSPDCVETTLALQRSMPPGMRASMAQDLEAGRRLELPWLSGRIHALGIEHGIPTPAHTATYRGLVLYANGKPG